MNPYDRRKVHEVWARVRPGQDVFAPGPQRPGQGGKPPGNGLRPPAPPPGPPEAQMAADALENLAAGYDFLAGRRRAPWLRRLAAQCRRGVRALQACAGVRAGEIPNTRADVCAQRRSEQALRDLLDQLDGPCRETAGRLRRESVGRSRAITRLR